MIYWQLFSQFFKIGLFAIGGGLTTLPFLYDLADQYGWFTHKMVVDMVAISESTPGPIGINMATYTGFHVAGIAGSLCATFGMALVSLLTVLIIAHYLKQYRDNKWVEAGFYGLRPAVTALIAAAGIEVLKVALFNLSLYLQTKQILNLFHFKAILLFALLLWLTNRYKKHPIVYLAAAAAIGVAFRF